MAILEVYQNRGSLKVVGSSWFPLPIQKGVPYFEKHPFQRPI